MGGAGSGRLRKMTEEQEAEAAVIYHRPEMTQRKVAARFGVSPATVMRAIVRAWRRFDAEVEGP